MIGAIKSKFQLNKEEFIIKDIKPYVCHPVKKRHLHK